MDDRFKNKISSALQGGTVGVVAIPPAPFTFCLAAATILFCCVRWCCVVGVWHLLRRAHYVSHSFLFMTSSYSFHNIIRCVLLPPVAACLSFFCISQLFLIPHNLFSYALNTFLAKPQRLPPNTSVLLPSLSLPPPIPIPPPAFVSLIWLFSTPSLFLIFIHSLPLSYLHHKHA